MAGYLLFTKGFSCPLFPLILITALEWCSSTTTHWPWAFCRQWFCRCTWSKWFTIIPLFAEKPRPCLAFPLLHHAASSQENSFSVKDSVTRQVEILGIELRSSWTCSTSNYHHFSTFAEFQPHNRCCPRCRQSWAFGLAVLRSQQAWQMAEMRGMHLVKMGSEKGHFG